jgi:hypothetical protein
MLKKTYYAECDCCGAEEILTDTKKDSKKILKELRWLFKGKRLFCSQDCKAKYIKRGDVCE